MKITTIDLFISIFNRPEYVERSFNSLLQSFDGLKPHIILTDDGSFDPAIKNLISTFMTKYTNTMLITNKINVGIPYGKLSTIKKCVCNSVYSNPLFLISDSDMIYKKGWIETLTSLYGETGAPLITGFNTLTNKHIVTSDFGTYYTKESIGGCNLLVSTEFYKAAPFMEPVEWDYCMCKRAHKQHPLGVVCSKPSVVDHIGVEGYWARKNYHDKAEDF